MSPDSLSSVPHIVGGPLFALFFFWVAMALGFRLILWMRTPIAEMTPWERGFLSVGLGSGCLQLMPSALAACHAMTPTFLRWGCGLLTLLLAPDLARTGHGVLRALGCISTWRPSRHQVAWGVLLGLVLGLLFLHAIAFRDFGDDDGYHLSAPKRWLASGSLDYLPTYTNTNASLGFEMLYAIALSISDVAGAKMLHYGAGLFTLLGVLLCARRLGNEFAGVVVVSLLLVRTPFSDVPLLLTVAYVDFGASWMAIASVLVWLAWRERVDGRLMACFGLFVGLAASFKLTCLALVLAWAPVVLIDARRAGMTWPRCTAVLAQFGLVTVAPLVPWLIRSFVVTGNPLYPMFSSLVPTRDWTVEHARVFGRYLRYYSWGIAQGARLDLTSRRTILGGTAVALIAFGAAAAVYLRRPPLRLLVLVSVVFAGSAVASTGLIFRYWLPATICGGLAVVAGLTQRLPRARWRYGLPCGVLAIALVHAARFAPPSVVWKNSKIACGLSTFAQEYPTDRGWNMWKYINSQTPADARILSAAFYTSTGASSFGGFWVDRPFFATDSHLQNYIRLDTWPAFVESVQGAAISHVLIFGSQQNAGRIGFSFPAGENEYPFCRRLVDEYGEKVAEFDDLQLYRVWPQRADRHIATAGAAAASDSR